MLVDSWLRWTVLGPFLGALAQSGKRRCMGRDRDIEDEVLARLVMIALSFQALLGFLPLVGSIPFTAAARRDWLVALLAAGTIALVAVP